MTTSRRDFVQLSILAGGAVGIGLANRAQAGNADVGTASKKLKILVLGGTGLIGPPMVEYAMARGHEVTLFNPGKTNSHLFPELEKLKPVLNATEVIEMQDLVSEVHLSEVLLEYLYEVVEATRFGINRLARLIPRQLASVAARKDLGATVGTEVGVDHGLPRL